MLLEAQEGRTVRQASIAIQSKPTEHIRTTDYQHIITTCVRACVRACVHACTRRLTCPLLPNVNSTRAS
jgi:hypothetical protein